MKSSPRCRAVRHALTLFACLVAATGCLATARFHSTTKLPIGEARSAVHAALSSAGYRDVEDETAGTDTALSSTVAERPGTSVQPFGLTARIDYQRQDAETIALDIAVSGFSIVSVSDWGEALKTQVENQIRLHEERMARAALRVPTPTPTPRVTTPSTGRTSLPPFTEQRHALIVGVSQYQDSNFSSLPRARKDAEALAKFLESDEGGNIASDRIHMLIDDEATRANIIRTLIQIGRETQPGDMIILYFACHARAPSGEKTARYLVPFDSDVRSPEATALEKRNLAKWLDEAEAKRQVVLLDCCFAGPVTRGDVEDDAFASLQGASRVVLTSTKGSETALDAVDEDDGNSPFATALLECLQGKAGIDADEDGRLNVEELYRALRLEVVRAAQRVGHKMTPQLYGDAAGEMEILRLR